MKEGEGPGFLYLVGKLNKCRICSPLSARTEVPSMILNIVLQVQKVLYVHDCIATRYIRIKILSGHTMPYVEKVQSNFIKEIVIHIVMDKLLGQIGTAQIYLYGVLPRSIFSSLPEKITNREKLAQMLVLFKFLFIIV